MGKVWTKKKINKKGRRIPVKMVLLGAGEKGLHLKAARGVDSQRKTPRA